MRSIPAVHRFLSDPRVAAFETLLGKEHVKQSVSDLLDGVRRTAQEAPSGETLTVALIDRLQRDAHEALVPVINATGILLHTNLGRAALAPAALEAMTRIGAGYSNLEFDLETGKRGSRYSRATGLLRAVTGAQDALVVNNCAAAVLLILDTFAKGREVVIARSELVEIGGGFRLPEVMGRSGARLVEVGATNKVYLEDFERALTPHTALLMRSHASNFRISGFVESVEPKDLAALGRRTGIPVIEDLGSGALVDLREYGLPHERTVPEAIADGIELVAFSGDKVLGGPQAGVIAGSAPLIARLRSNPLLRALRVDKLTFAALTATLQLYASPERRNEIPFFAMLSATLADLRARAQRYRDALPDATVVASIAYAGGGTLPESEVPSVAVAFMPQAGAENVAARLRARSTPVIARVEQNRLILDMRTIRPQEDLETIAALKSTLA